jgi:caffeoyl-CoA O-methyltransferase
VCDGGFPPLGERRVTPDFEMTKPKEILKYTPLNDRLYRYLCDTRSHATDRALDDLRRETAALGEVAEMQIGPDQGSFMTLLVAAIGTRNGIEIGSFTGYSSICIARGLPEKGRLLCLDASAEWTNIARKYWRRAGVEKKIELRLGPAVETLKRLEAGRKFDFAFIDADKPAYDAYYELILPRMRPNGLILFDNMLWGGRLGKKGVIKHPNGRAIERLNRKLARDCRVESVLLSIGDGVQLCRVLGV